MAQASTERQARSVRPVQRHKGLIAITTLAVMASALVASLAQHKVYRATSVVDVGPAAQGGVALTVAGELAALHSANVRSAVAAKGRNPTAVTVKADGGNDIEVTAEAGTAAGAAALANDYVGAYLAQRRQELNAGPARDLRARIDDLQRQIDPLAGEIAKARTSVAGTLAARRDALVRQREGLQRQLDALGRTPLTVISARPPHGAIRPRTLRNTVLGLAVGLLAGFLLALVLELRRRRTAALTAAPTAEPAPPPAFVSALPEPEPWAEPEAEPEPAAELQPVPEVEAEQAVADQQLAPEPDPESHAERSGPGVPVLGMIPAVAAWRGREVPLLRRDQPTTTWAEAYRNLAATVQRILPHRPLRSIVVTSPGRGDGKTTVAANLGIVLARGGKSVVVVDCDLRRSRLHELFGLPNEAGFTSVLRGEAPLSRAVQDIPDEHRLQVLAAGPPPTDPAQLLSAQRTMEVLTALQAQADVLVIDVPAVEPNGDAAVVASIADAALVIAGAPSGQAADLARSVDLLDAVDGLVVGVVLNAVEDPDSDGRVAMLRRDQPRVSLA